MLKVFSTSTERGIFHNFHYIWKCTITNDTLPVIKVPQKMIQNLEKHKMKKSYTDDKLRKLHRKSNPVVLACKRTEFNHHRGEKFKDESTNHLASHGWKHYKSQGDYFSLVPHKRNPALVQSDHKSSVSFSELEISERLANGLKELGFKTLTKIQAESIPLILKGKQLIMAAETGSGKTLAYLIPIMERINQAKQYFNREGVCNTPMCIILSPSRELAYQIGEVIKSLNPYTDISCVVECGPGVKNKLEWPRYRKVDILVSTPGILLKQIKAGNISGEDLQHMVLDEADTLIDDSFCDIIGGVFNNLNVGGGEALSIDNTIVQGGIQFLLVSATLPRGLQQSVGDYIPIDKMQKVTTPGLHRIMPHVPQKFIRVKEADKIEKVVVALKTRPKPTMVFCNKSNTAYWLSKALEEQNIDNILMSGGISDRERRGTFDAFQGGKKDVLVATDIASRGLDTTWVKRVINYDFPQFMSDYIHRVGRVGRIGAPHVGEVISLVSQKWDVELLWKIETAVRRESELHNVNANIKRKLESLAEANSEEEHKS